MSISKWAIGLDMASESPSKNRQGSGKDGDARMNPRGNYKGTREEWLEAVLAIVAPWLDEAVRTVWATHKRMGSGQTATQWRSFNAKHRVRAAEIRFSCSLLSSGMKSGPHAAHVQYKQSTGNEKHEIRMGVALNGTTKHDSIIVAGILMHEVLHTMAIGDGHRGMFPIIGKAAGLTGKPTAMMAEKDTPLYDRLNAEVIGVLGKYPHKAVELKGRMAKRGQRKIGSRSIKCQCPECECIIRLTRMWLDRCDGEPVCPMQCGVFMEVEA
jgi:hypothetical protein